MQILKDRALVKFDAPADRTPSGRILIPSEAREPAYTGTVLAIGPEQFNICVGDRILFSRYAGVPLPGAYFVDRANTYSQERSLYVVVDNSEILAVFTDDTRSVKRTTYALDSSALRFLAGNRHKDDKLIYLNYVHASDTVYATFEREETEVCLPNNKSSSGALVRNKSYLAGFNEAIALCLAIVYPNPEHPKDEDHERECSEVAAEIRKLLQ